VAVPDPKAILALKREGVLVIPVAHDRNLVEVSAVNTPDVGDADVKLLLPLAEQIIWLKIGNTKITDAGLKELSRLKNLNKLHLEYTGVTDVGLSELKDLKYLEYVNLVGTKVTDAGLKIISSSKSLKNIYVWKSGITESGIAVVKKLHPELNIVSGFNEGNVAEFLKAGDSLKKEDRHKLID